MHSRVPADFDHQGDSLEDDGEVAMAGCYGNVTVNHPEGCAR